MNDKVRSLLMLMVGCYIAFLGGDLLMGVVKGQSEQPLVFGIIGAVFVALGIIVVIYNIKRTIAIEKRLDEEALEEERWEAEEARRRAEEELEMQAESEKQAENTEE